MGATVTINITEISSSMVGTYSVVWSTSAVFNQDETIVLRTGSIASGSSSVVIRITVPESPSGSYIVSFQPENSTTNTNFQFSVKPDIRTGTQLVLPGEMLQVRGSGFSASQTVTLKLDNKIIESNIRTDINGSFYQTILVPELDAGTYTLAATDINTGMGKSIEIEILPVIIDEPDDEDIIDEPDTNNIPVIPPEEEIDDIAPHIPTPISPMRHRYGMVGEQIVSFLWSKVTDESGVIYEMEVVNNSEPSPSPSDIVLRVENLSVNNYTTILDSGTYYWRVRAIDGAGNESAWQYAQYAFKVGELSVLVDEFVDVVEDTGIFPGVLWVVVIFILVILLITIIKRLVKLRH